MALHKKSRNFYFADISDEASRHNQARITASEAIQHEDTAICESVQRGLASRSYSAGRLSARREAGEHLFHRLLYSDLKSGAGEGSHT
jgi:choline monooxygenase